MCLVRERLVHKRKQDRRYLLGPLLFELSLAIPEFAEFQAVCAAPLARLAKRSSGVAFLNLRSGMDFVCAARVGKLTSALSIYVGTRRPLAASASGAAILAVLPPREASAIIAHNMRVLERSGGVPIKSLNRMLRRSESLGYGANLGDIIPGWNALGVAIRNAHGIPFAALMIAAPEDKLPRARISEMVAMLEDEIRQIELETIRIFQNID